MRVKAILAVNIVLIMAIGLAVFAYSRRPGILVVVKNSDPTPISNVQVFVGGKIIDLGTIAAGAKASGRVIPVGDSSLLIQFTDPSGRKQVQVDTYITGGYRGQIDAELRGGAVVSHHEDLDV